MKKGRYHLFLDCEAYDEGNVGSTHAADRQLPQAVSELRNLFDFFLLLSLLEL